MEAILSQGFCCWYSAGLAALTPFFFPDHQVHRIRVPDPFSGEIEDASAEASTPCVLVCYPLLREKVGRQNIPHGMKTRKIPVSGQLPLGSDTTSSRKQLAVTQTL